MVSSSVSPLRRRRDADVQIDDVGRQALGRDLEGGARARAVLEEEVEHGLPAQQRHLLHVALGDRDERHGGVEDAADHLRRQALEREQVLQLAGAVELRVTHAAAPSAGSTDSSRLPSRRRCSTIERSRATASARADVGRLDRQARGRRGRSAPRARSTPGGRSRTAR